MAKYSSLPKTLAEADRQTIQNLILATEQRFAGDLFGEVNSPLNEAYTTPDGSLHFSTTKDLLVYVTDLTDTNDVRSANRVLYQNLSSTPEYSAPTMTPAPEQIASNVPQEGIREVQKAELERRNADIKASTEKARRDVQNIINQKQKFAERQRIIENQKAKLEQLKQKLEGRKMYAKITSQTTSQELPQNVTLREQINISPRQFVKTTAREIQKNITDPNIPTEEKETIAQKVALETYKSLKGDSSYKKATTNLAIASDDVVKNLGLSEEEQSLLKMTARAESAQDISSAEIYKRLIDSTKVGGIQTRIELSLNPQEGFEEININQNIISPQINFLNEQSEMLKGFDLPFDLVSNKFKSQILHRIRSSLTAEIEKLPEGGIINNEAVKFALVSAGIINASKISLAVDTSFLGNLFVASGYGPLAGFIQGITGWDLGIIEFPITAGIEHLPGGITFIGGETSFFIGGGTAGMPVFSEASFAGMEFIGIGGESIAGAELIGFGGESIAGFGFAEAAAPIISEVATGTATTVAGEAAGLAAGTTATVVGATTVGATTTAGAAAGTAIPIPGVGTLIGAVVGFIAASLPKIGHWLKEKFGNIGHIMIGGLGAGVGAAIGTATGVGALAGAIVGGLSGAGLSVAFTGGIPALGSAITSGVTTAFSALGTIMSTFLAGIAAPIIAFLIGFPVLVVLILIIINSGAYLVPPTPPGEGYIGSGIEVECSDEKGPVGVDGPNSTSPIANRAWKITYDLYQGFWCYWNRSPIAPPQYFPNDTLKYPPGYPDTFGYEQFKANPNPASGTGLDMYWCTYLVINAYHENGNNIAPNGAATNMFNDFNSRLKVISNDHVQYPSANPITSNEYPTPDNIVPGSVAFFHVSTGHSNVNHVGVVYSVDKGGITFVQSNGPLKSQTLNFTSQGVGNITDGSVTIYVVGFGLP